MRPPIGYGIRKENRSIMDEPCINAVEITFEHADEPLRTNRFLGDLEFDYVSIHGLELSVASPEDPPMDYLRKMRSVADENGAAAVSDHLGFTRDHTGGVCMGHFAPPPFSQAALDVVCRNVDFVQSYFGDVPFYLENIAYFFRFRGEFNEPDFLSQILNKTGCGWLLDVTNVYANAVNHDYDAKEFIQQVMPHASRVQMHLAGGYFDEDAKMYFDSHSEPVPDDVWDLYRMSLELAGPKTDAVFIERDDNFPNEQGWRSEIRTASEIAAEVGEVPG